MVITIQAINKTDASIWDTYVDTFPQSFAWGESRVKNNQSLIRLVVEKDSLVVTYIQGIVKKIPFSPYSIVYIYRSPLYSFEILKALQIYGHKNHIIFFRLEPNEFETKKTTIIPLLKKTSQTHFAEWSPFIDLNKNFEDIEKNFSKTVRNETRLAKKNQGYINYGIDAKLFEDFLVLSAETHSRKKFTGYTTTYYQTVFETLRKYNQVQLFVGYDSAHKPVVGAMVFFFKDTVTYAYGGSLGRETPKGMMNLLMVSIIQYAQLHGFKTLD